MEKSGMSREKTLLLATLVFPVREGKVEKEVLLAEKLDKIGKGSLNGWGGGVEPDETIRDAAIREFFEESGGAVASPKHLKKIGIAHFRNNKSDGTAFTCVVHIFTLSHWIGKIRPTPEMGKANWYKISEIPKNKLMLADSFWLPRMLSGEKANVYAEYGPRQETLVSEVLFRPADYLEGE